ncbi:hypothetical protein A5668_13085 [Mycolicibacterium fortuitum]|uniref:Uncharacterized protein n=1 Tax=Mycolicibacterium fortuitum TaxID=1766 RepID=A0ABD6QPK0_MYCFO|nr:hypothetical protein A5668_13085 [Mycolicibacterium fortuitum]OMC47386.1 hypothetical protein A5742_24585 [Mycolicibacterium fortuitum]
MTDGYPFAGGAHVGPGPGRAAGFGPATFGYAQRTAEQGGQMVTRNSGRADDRDYDPDADPEMLQPPQRQRPQPDQAEGADDPAETGAD